jgi:YVTN family beta-propeller protein
MRPGFLASTIGLALAAALAGGALADQIYVPLGNANRILIVDPARDAVVGSIDGLPNVHGLAGTPDGKLLIAGSYDERPAGGPAPEKPAGVSADEHAAHHATPPAGAAKPDAMISTLSMIRTSDRRIVRRIDVPGAVHHVATSPDGRLAAVTHPDAGAVSVVDLVKFAVISTIATGPAPNYAAFAPDGKSLYVSNTGNDTVSEIDATRLYVRRNIRVGAAPEHLVLSRDGRTLYVNNVQDGTVSVLSLRSGSARTIAVGDALHGIDLSEDGRTLFVAALGLNRIVAIDIATGETRETPLAPAPYHLAVIRGTGKIYVSSAQEPKTWVVDQKTLHVIREIAIGGKGHQMVRSPGA